jgi:phosphoribosylformimino-5-aminoimidazole carboxamide ribotide isomerase
MRVIGVVDLLAGRAVHARAGQRESYAPVETVAGSPIEPGSAAALAHAYIERLGIRELYAADLDGILGRAPQDALVAAVAALGAPLWLDAGVSSVDHARRVQDLGAARIVVGLETLPSFKALEEICAVLGSDRVAFSLDLRNGKPIVADGDILPREPAHAVAARAADAGAGAVIVIDLARVGTGAGLDLAMIARVRSVSRELTLLAGGGVRGWEDLEQLAAAGCDAALVATALHDGRLGAADVAEAERLGPGHLRLTR